MRKYQEKFTPLTPLIAQILANHPSRQDLEAQRFTQPIQLAIINKYPYLCLSDLRNSIQAFKPSKEEQPKTHPFNKLKSHFYCVIDRSWISVNAFRELLKDGSQFPHPYEPYFHFKQNYEEYRSEKEMMNYRGECQVIRIESWRVKVVNISNTGYYSLALEILQSRAKNQKFIENLANISSVIYEPFFHKAMERFRLADMRCLYKHACDKKVPFSLFYYCRDNQLEDKSGPNKIAVVDKEKMIRCGQSQPYHLINFGLMEGIYILQRPLASQEINLDKIKTMNLDTIQVFFNALPIKKQPSHEDQPLWSSDESDQVESNYEAASSGSEEQESDSQDPLRNLYMKQFEDMKLG